MRMLKNGERCNDISILHELVYRLPVDLLVKSGVFMKTFQFRSEEEQAIFPVIITGFYAGTVTEACQFLLLRVIAHKSVHAYKAPDHLCAPLLPCMQYHFRI